MTVGDALSRSPIVGRLRLPERGGPELAEIDRERVLPALVELNVRYPGGLARAQDSFFRLWQQVAEGRWAGQWPEQGSGPPALEPRVPPGLAYVAPKLFQCVLARTAIRDLVAADARRTDLPPRVIFRLWPDYEIEPQIDRSAPTVKADAAWRSYAAGGSGVVWAVLDSGIDATHPHFAGLELAEQAAGRNPQTSRTVDLHRDFSYLVNPDSPAGAFFAPPPPQAAPTLPASVASALTDQAGHGTHVAGIISGRVPDRPGIVPRVADSREVANGGFVQRPHGVLSGMAPRCELVSLKVVRRSNTGTWITSASAMIRALTYLRTEANTDPGLLQVHGVNISLGCSWDPSEYAAGQSPLCQAVNELVALGVVVVVSAGNYGSRQDAGDASAALGSVTEPSHAQDCISVGSTHRDAPHVFGVSWTSGKGPTLDGRMKPDVVAPGEWICSAAAGAVRAGAGLDVGAAPPGDDLAALNDRLTYAEQSGTSMAAPHVSGVIAGFLSVRPEFIGRPQRVKDLLKASATDLGRERYAQGAGLVDLMRMLSDV